MKIQICQAQIDQAPIVARMIMEAMDHDCCQWFAGEHHTLDDFYALMQTLVRRTDSQYSYRNTLVAVDGESRVVGVCVSYDGSRLRSLRKAFIEGAKAAFGKDYSTIPDETQAGELYIDSLCVDKNYRKMGIASALLRATIAKGEAMGLPTALLVDKGNPKAEKLYTQIGFEYKDDNEWGGHPMRHLVYSLRKK